MASPFVMSIIKHGYTIPFKTIPAPYFLKNNLLSLRQNEFTARSILELKQKGFISEITEPAYCSNPLTVAEKNGKLRLVLDCRGLNHFLAESKFKYEGVKIQYHKLLNQIITLQRLT